MAIEDGSPASPLEPGDDFCRTGASYHGSETDLRTMDRLIDSELLVHIGLHKTGSTWLQHRVFSRPESGFYGPAEEGSRGVEQVKRIGRTLTTNEDGRLLNEDEFDSDEFRASISGLTVRDGLCPVVSNERLGGHPFSNGFDRAMLCRRLHAVFPKARILICIREQRSMILSNYMQYLRYGGWHTLQDYLQPQYDPRQPALDRRFWEYHRLIALYRNLFGGERVLVLPYEMLAEDPGGFVGRICTFVDRRQPEAPPDARPANVRSPHFSSYYLRRLGALRFRSSANAFFPSLLGHRAGAMIDRAVRTSVDRIVPASLETRTKRALERRVELLTRGIFDASNRMSEELTGLDLARYGYAVETASVTATSDQAPPQLRSSTARS